MSGGKIVGNETRTALLRAHREGRFLDHVIGTQYESGTDEESLAADIVALHNSGELDAVEAFAALKNSGHAFFSARGVFESALPEIDAGVESVMVTVQHLVREAGGDLAAPTIIDGLKGYLLKDPSRIQGALQIIESRPEFSDLLSAVLSTGSETDLGKYADETLRLTRSDNPEMKKQALFALSSLHWPQGQCPPDKVYAALEDACANDDRDEILAVILTAAVRLAERDPQREDRVAALAQETLKRGDAATLHAASNLSAYGGKSCPEKVIDVLLGSLKDVDPKNAGTIHNIDHAAYRLIRRSRHEKALAFVEDLLLTHAEAMDAQQLSTTLHALQKDDDLRNKATTRWLLGGEPALCKAAEFVVGGGHGANPILEVDTNELDPPSPVKVLFLAKKVAGYLFLSPTSAASMLVSLMRRTDDAALLGHLANLLLDPILLNFPGKPRSYVEERRNDGSQLFQRAITQALNALEEHFVELRSIGTLPELHPSEAQREAHYRHHAREMTESVEKAQRKSPFFGLFTRQNLLYGRKSIAYIYDGDGAAHRQEIPLKEHSFTYEYPRIAELDPLGLEYQLMMFRAEAWRQ